MQSLCLLLTCIFREFFFSGKLTKQNMAWTFQCREAMQTGNLAQQPKITQKRVQDVQDFRSKAV